MTQPPFLITLKNEISSSWKSDEKNAIQIHKYGVVEIDKESLKSFDRKNFYGRFLSKSLHIRDALIQEIMIGAYDSNNIEIGSIFLIIENLISSKNNTYTINDVSASGIFKSINNITQGKLFKETNQIILLY